MKINTLFIISIVIFLVAIISIIVVNHIENDKLSDTFKYIGQATDINTYIICLPKRRKYMQNVVNHFKLNSIFIEPILKDTLNVDKLIGQKLLDKNYKEQERTFIKNEDRSFSGLNKGRIACHLSHMKTLQTFLKSNNKNCLILEDDIKITDSQQTLDTLNKVLNSLPKNWEYVNLGRCWDHCHKDKPVNKWLVKSPKSLCRHAYIVTRNGAKKILDYCLPMKGYPGDWHYSKMIKNNLINGYSTKEQVFLQNRDDMKSNLGNRDDVKQLTCAKQ